MRRLATGPLTQTGKQLAENRDHKKQINDLTLSADLTHFVTGSLDKTARVRDCAVQSAARPVCLALL